MDNVPDWLRDMDDPTVFPRALGLEAQDTEKVTEEPEKGAGAGGSYSTRVMGASRPPRGSSRNGKPKNQETDNTDEDGDDLGAAGAGDSSDQ